MRANFVVISHVGICTVCKLFFRYVLYLHEYLTFFILSPHVCTFYMYFYELQNAEKGGIILIPVRRIKHARDLFCFFLGGG